MKRCKAKLYGRRCMRPEGHWRFVDTRGYHHTEQQNTGEVAKVYSATWVRLWRGRP